MIFVDVSFTPIVDRKLDTHILIGNHDTYYKNTNEVNSVQELVGNKYDNIKYYTESDTVSFDVHTDTFCSLDKFRKLW